MNIIDFLKNTKIPLIIIYSENIIFFFFYKYWTKYKYKYIKLKEIIKYHVLFSSNQIMKYLINKLDQKYLSKNRNINKLMLLDNFNRR